jgi:hypothetical protein
MAEAMEHDDSELERDTSTVIDSGTFAKWYGLVADVGGGDFGQCW